MEYIIVIVCLYGIIVTFSSAMRLFQSDTPIRSTVPTCPKCNSHINESMLIIGSKICESCFDKDYDEYMFDVKCPHNEPLHNHHDGCPACYSQYVDDKVQQGVNR